MNSDALVGAACAVLGLLVGAVTPGIVRWAASPDEVRCPRWLVMPLAAVTFGLVGWRVGPSAALPVDLYLAGVGVALAMIDLAVHRLPDRLVLPSYPVLAALLTAASLARGEPRALIGAAIGGVALFGAYYLLAVAAPSGMGFGDVKLAGLLGMVLGWVGWSPLIVGTFLGFLYGGVVSVLLVLARRATRKTAVPFGPFMLAGALTAVCFGTYLSAGTLGA